MPRTFKDISESIKVEKLGRVAAMDAITFTGDVYMYGVWSGMSTKFISDYLSTNQIEYNKMFGFDSFVGLPEEKEFIKHPGHTLGKYSSVDLYKDTCINTMEKIQTGVGNDKLKLIPGFYEDVLDKELTRTEKMWDASFIDLDVDLCSSAITVLDFMCESALVISGTVIYFDDWGATPEYKGGVSLAWKTIVEKHSLEYEEIFSTGKRPYVLKVFVIK